MPEHFEVAGMRFGTLKEAAEHAYSNSFKTEYHESIVGFLERHLTVANLENNRLSEDEQDKLGEALAQTCDNANANHSLRLLHIVEETYGADGWIPYARSHLQTALGYLGRHPDQIVKIPVKRFTEHHSGEHGEE